MHKTIFLFTTAFLLFLMSGCAQKVNVRALEPAEIDRVANTKKITVTNFKNDRVGLSRKIEANLASFSIDTKNYFTIIGRNDFEKIIEEQKLQNSGLVEPGTAVRVGELIGAQAIISGNVGSATSEDSYFYEERVKCANKKCSELTYYKVRCKKRVVGLSAELRIVDVQKGDMIFADRLSRSAEYKHCSDDSRALPSREMAAQRLSVDMANSFTYRLTPHYKTFKVALLEEPDLDYNDKQDELLEVSLKYIEQGRFDKAEQFLSELIDATASQSYVAFYNLGVIKEAQGNYKEAKEYYEYADNLMVEPVEEINAAVIRISSLIEKRERTHEQIQR
jgi:tetratricopeptide (TPR) repeat protein